MTTETCDLHERQLGLGTFPFSNVFAPVDQDTAEAIVRRFLETGGRYIETAPIYPRARVDLPRILKTFSRDRFLLGTKCVLHIGPDGETASSGEANSIRSQCIAEMNRLGVDYLDLLQAHLTAEDVLPEVVSSALNALRSEGMIRYVGVANASASDMKSYLKGGMIDLVQNRYSIVHRSTVDSITNICRDNDIFLNPYQVIERGQLVTDRKDDGAWPDRDLRSTKAEYIGDAYQRIHDWAMSRLGSIAGEAGLTLEALSIRWVFSNPQVSMPVIGATQVAHVERNMEAGTEPLSREVMEAIESAYSDLALQVRELFGLSVEEFRGLG